MKRQHTNQILRMTHFSSSSAFCQTEVVSRLSPVYTLLSLSLWPNHPPSPSFVSHYLPLFFPLLSCSLLIHFLKLPLDQTATFPKHYLLFGFCMLWNTCTCRYSRGGARWGGATNFHLTLCFFPMHTQTHSLTLRAVVQTQCRLNSWIICIFTKILSTSLLRGNVITSCTVTVGIRIGRTTHTHTVNVHGMGLGSYPQNN